MKLVVHSKIMLCAFIIKIQENQDEKTEIQHDKVIGFDQIYDIFLLSVYPLYDSQ